MHSTTSASLQFIQNIMTVIPDNKRLPHTASTSVHGNVDEIRSQSLVSRAIIQPTGR